MRRKRREHLCQRCGFVQRQGMVLIGARKGLVPSGYAVAIRGQLRHKLQTVERYRQRQDLLSQRRLLFRRDPRQKGDQRPTVIAGIADGASRGDQVGDERLRRRSWLGKTVNDLLPLCIAADFSGQLS